MWTKDSTDTDCLQFLATLDRRFRVLGSPRKLITKKSYEFRFRISHNLQPTTQMLPFSSFAVEWKAAAKKGRGRREGNEK